MIRLEARRRAGFGGAALSATLCGCITVLPKSPPVQLYTFGERAAAVTSPPAAAASVARTNLVLTMVTLPRPAAGDQILTLTGQEAAYVAGARWLTPAVLMFQADAERVLQTDARRTRLLARGDYGAAQALLRVDVNDFEARYDQGRGAAPTIVVSLRATLERPSGDPLADETFTVREPAAANRIGAIVEAYDRATSQVLDRAAAWTDMQAGALATSPKPRQPGTDPH